MRTVENVFIDRTSPLSLMIHDIVAVLRGVQGQAIGMGRASLR